MVNVNKLDSVWIFQGSRANFPSGIFYNIEQAETWISDNSLSGLLTKYPIGISVYDWAVKNDHHPNSVNKPISASAIERFTSACLEHYHYESGEKVS